MTRRFTPDGWADLRRTAEGADHCHGLVVRDGEQDACGKTPVAIVDGHGTEDETFWPACAYHANRYGRGQCVPVVDVFHAGWQSRGTP